MTVVSAVTGIVFGISGGPAYILIIWGTVAFVFGYYSMSQKDALVNGFLFGFLASFFFMWHGYAGNAPAITRTPFFGGLGAFGGTCGLLLSLIGNLASKHFKK